MTASTAPKMFGTLGAAAKKAGTAVEGAQKHVTAFGVAAEKAEPQVSALTKASRGLSSAFKKMPTDMESNLLRASRGFATASRAASNFGQVARGAAVTSASSFAAVGSALGGVRADAYAAASAVRTITSAARNIPRNIRINAHVGATGSAGGMGMNPAMLGAAAAGSAAAATLANGVSGASSLQGATLQAAIATGKLGPNLAATTANMAGMGDIAFAMSKMTGQNITESMGVIAAMTSAGVSPATLGQIYRPIAQFGDVLRGGKDHMDYGESAKMGAGLVHDLRLGLSNDPAANQQQTAYGLARIAQLGYLSPHGTNQLVTQIRRMAPQLENILPGTTYQKTDEIVKLAAWADRMGNLPFAGSAISQLATQMIEPRSRRVLNAMSTLGVYSADGKTDLFMNQRTGEFDFMGALMAINRRMTALRAQGKGGDAIQALFGNTQNATRILSALSSKEALSAYGQLSRQMSGMGADPVAWMNSVQTQFMSQLSMQTLQLKSNFEDLTTYIGQSMLPGLSSFVGSLAKITGDLAGFAKNNPRAAQAAAGGLAAIVVGGGAASLALGGLIAADMGRAMLGRLFGKPLAGEIGKEAGAAFGSGGWRGLLASGGKFAGGMLGGAGRFGINATGLGAVGSVKGFAGTAGQMIGDLAKLGPSLFRTRGGFLLIAETLGKLGLKAIPVVGQVLLLIDTIRFLGNNSHSIGWLIGKAAHMVVDGLHSIWDAMMGLFKNLMWVATHPGQAIVSGVGGLLNWGKNAGQNFVGGIKDGWSGPPPSAHPAASSTRATGAHNHGGGKVAYSGGTVNHTGSIDIHLHGSGVANMSHADKRELAAMIGDQLAAAMARDTAYAHGGTQTVGTDAYGGSNYHSAYGVPGAA